MISNFLSSLCEIADETKTELRIVQKPNDRDGCEHPFVTQIDDNGKVLEKLRNCDAQIAAGTSWLW